MLDGRLRWGPRGNGGRRPYRGTADGLLIVLASWSPDDVTVRLSVEAGVLAGLPNARAHAPAVSGLQEAQEVDPSRVVVPANQGLFILVEPGDDRR